MQEATSKASAQSLIQLLEEVWKESPDWASSVLSNLPVCVFIHCTAQQASINLHRLSKHSHELFSLDNGIGASFFLHLLPILKSPSCWIYSEYKTFCRKSPSHYIPTSILLQLAEVGLVGNFSLLIFRSLPWIVVVLCKEWGANSKETINCRLTHLFHHR